MWYDVLSNWCVSIKNSITFWFSGIMGNMKISEKTLGKLIDKQKVCYISSVDKEGYPNIKAMLRPRKRNGLKEFFLSTNTSSQKVQAYRKNPKACLYFCDKRFYRGLMFKGTVEVLQDQDSKTMLWEDGDTMYYEGGVTDPDYCVLKFTASSARFYQNFKSVDIDNIEVEETDYEE